MDVAASTSERSGKSQEPPEKREKLEFDPEEYVLRKRLPIKWPKRKIDVYVTRKTRFAAQFDRCQKLLNSGESELFIHGLGAAVSRAIHLALQLKSKYHGSVDVMVTTATVTLCDDLVPKVDELDADSRTRKNSAIHIRVFRPALNNL